MYKMQKQVYKIMIYAEKKKTYKTEKVKCLFEGSDKEYQKFRLGFSLKKKKQVLS